MSGTETSAVTGEGRGGKIGDKIAVVVRGRRIVICNTYEPPPLPHEHVKISKETNHRSLISKCRSDREYTDPAPIF